MNQEEELYLEQIRRCMCILDEVAKTETKNALKST